MKGFRKYGRKVSWIVKGYWKYGRKISRNVKRYVKYIRKVSWIVKIMGNTEENRKKKVKYRRK